jgi:mRNA interferase YafQ
MYEIVFKKKFKSSYKKIAHSGKFKRENFNEILFHLEKGTKIPDRYHDHALTGNLFGTRECHIESDMLLLYEIDEQNKTVTLMDMDNHANLFGS